MGSQRLREKRRASLVLMEFLGLGTRGRKKRGEGKGEELGECVFFGGGGGGGDKMCRWEEGKGWGGGGCHCVVGAAASAVSVPDNGFIS